MPNTQCPVAPRVICVAPNREQLTDAALEELLRRAYVEDGHTAAEVAREAFAAAAVRARGELLSAHEVETGRLMGCIIYVPHTSAARRVAVADEGEVQLLAVHHAFRGQGVGEALVRAVLSRAADTDCHSLVLWTQPAMLTAQKLYQRVGFERQPERDFSRGAHSFLVYTLSQPSVLAG
jgi:ribosomal protein S18 acetylase RimI-like enzyme